MAVVHKSQVLADLSDTLHRRGNVMVLMFVLGCVVSLVIALHRPYIFRSTETIQIVPGRVAGALITHAPAEAVETRMEVLRQRLLGRQSLVEIAQAYNLFHGENLVAEEMARRLNDSVTIKNVLVNGTLSALRISADMPDPELARLIAQELSHRIINMNATSRIKRAREMLEFFSLQEQELFRDLSETEDMIETLLEAGPPAAADSRALRKDEIASTSRAIAQIDLKRIDIQNRLGEVQKSGRINDPRNQIGELIQQMNTLDVQRRLLSDRRNELTSSNGPLFEIERELTNLSRHKRLLEGQIDLMSQRRSTAEVSYLMETRRQAEKLVVIEPAARPDEPVYDPRLRTMVVGTIFSLIAALAAAVFLDWRSPVIRSARLMKRTMGFAPIAVIPRVDREKVKPSLWGRVPFAFRK